MFASRLAPWLTRRGVHYGWLMVALTFLTTVCSSAAISLSGILVLPLVQEFGWGRADIGAVMGLMLLLFAGTAPFGGAIMFRLFTSSARLPAEVRDVADCLDALQRIAEVVLVYFDDDDRAGRATI